MRGFKKAELTNYIYPNQYHQYIPIVFAMKTELGQHEGGAFDGNVIFGEQDDIILQTLNQSYC